MSDALSDAQMLSIWERGIALGPTGRALLTIEIARAGVDAQAIARWPLGRRDALLLQLRRATFGPSIRYRACCPFCESELEFDAAVDSLSQGDGSSVEHFAVEVDGLKLQVRLPTSEDLRAIEGCDDAAAAARVLWSRCVSSGEGEDIAAVPEASDSLREHIESLLETADPLADLSFSLACASCGGTWTAPCDIAQTLWREIAESARRILAQVDALARRYGWSESEVLHLTRLRRDMYLAFAEQ